MTKEEEAYSKYIETLPKKRMAAGVIIRNKEKEILMVKPSYKPVLEIPGGIIEKDESPLQACQREVQEELGITLKIDKMLCLDYNAPKGKRTESLMFIFYGGDLSDKQIQEIKVDGQEIIDYTFLSLKDIKDKTTVTLYRRIEKSIWAIDKNQALYLENQSFI